MVPSLRRLLPMLVGMVAAGGCLAVEFPNDLYEPSRALMRMIAADGPWAKTLLPIAKTRPFNETMEGLYALAQSDLRRRRHLGDDLPPRHGERRGDRRMDGGDEARALPGGAGRQPIVASFSIATPRNCARPIRLCPTARLAAVAAALRAGAAVSAAARPVHPRGFAFIARAQSASSIRSAISRR